MDFTIHHVAISATDMTESVAFYEQFGFRVVVHWKDPDGELEIAHRKLGANYLEIFWYRDQAPAPETAASLATDLPRIGVKHFALSVVRSMKPRILSRTAVLRRTSKFNKAGLV